VGRGIRTSRWKYYAVAEDADPWDVPAASRYREQALYDLENDPHELVNLAGFASHAEVAARLRERLLRRIAEAEGAEPVIDPAVARPAPAQAMTDPEVRLRGPKPVRFGHQGR
jgi:arylsulfatase A-like enzyme